MCFWSCESALTCKHGQSSFWKWKDRKGSMPTDEEDVRIVLSKTSKILWYLLPPKSALRKSGFLTNSSCENKELSLKCVCMKIGFTSGGYAADVFWKQQQFEPPEFYAQLRFSAGKLARMSNKCWHSQHVTTQIGCFHCQQFYVGAAPFHRHHH